MSIELSEQEQLRRQSLAALRELGIDPYPAARYEVTATATFSSICSVNSIIQR